MTRSPLPFLGQKTKFIKYFKEVLFNMQSDGFINNETLFIDIFGGSGLLSHTIKQMFPNNRVIYNDYDNFKERLDNIEITESLRAEIYEVIQKDATLQRDTYLQKNTYLQINQIIQNYINNNYYIDWISISAWLMFKYNYCYNLETLQKNKYYNRIAKKPLKKGNYLEGVEFIRLDFLEVLNKYNNINNKILILDPPYLKTNCEGYVSAFSIKKTILMLKNTQKPFILFSSERTELIDLIELFDLFDLIDLKPYKILYPFNRLNKQLNEYIIYTNNNTLI